MLSTIKEQFTITTLGNKAKKTLLKIASLTGPPPSDYQPNPKINPIPFPFHYQSKANLIWTPLNITKLKKNINLTNIMYSNLTITNDNQSKIKDLLNLEENEGYLKTN